MNTSEVSSQDRVIAVIARVMKLDPTKISRTDRLREDLGMDSLESLELLSVVSDELQIDIELDEAMEMQTVDDTCSFVDRLVKQATSGVGSNVT